MKDDHVDIAVVGAGPAGSIAAYTAVQRGFTVALIDRQTFPRDKTCGDGIGPGAVRIAKQLGFDDIFANRQPTSSVTIFGPTGVRSDAEINEKTKEGYVIPRLIFDQFLFQGAIEKGAQDYSGMRFVTTSLSGNKRIVELLDSQGNKKVITAQLIIGADGAHSAVRKSLLPARFPAEHIFLAIRAYAQSAAFQPGGLIGPSAIFELSQELLPSYGWVFPIGDGRVNIGVGGPLTELQRRGTNLKDLLDNFSHQLIARGIDLGGFTEKRAHHLPTVGGMPPLVYPRAALIGDAAGMINPTSGEGIAYAMTAAVKLTNALPADLADDDAVTQALAGFEKQFRRQFRLHFLTSRTAVNLLHRPLWSNMFIRAIQEDPRVFSDTIDLLFDFGRLKPSTAFRVLRAGIF